MELYRPIYPRRPWGILPRDLRQIGCSGADITTPRALFSKSQEKFLTEAGIDEGAVIKDGARSMFDRQPPCPPSWLANEASQESDQSKSSVLHLLNVTESSQKGMYGEVDAKQDSLGTLMTLMAGSEAE